jgi:prefoldin beta subunit
MDENEFEKLTMDYQKVEEQLQNLKIQKEQYKMQVEEYKQAEEEVSKANGKVYNSIGGVIVETTKEDAIKNIQEKEESTEMRSKIIDKNIADLSKKEEELKTKANEIIKEMKSNEGKNGQGFDNISTNMPK